MNFEMLNRPYGEAMADHRIPFRQQKDLRRIIFKAIAEFAPFAAAVREVFVDCGNVVKLSMLLRGDAPVCYKTGRFQECAPKNLYDFYQLNRRDKIFQRLDQFRRQGSGISSGGCAL